MQTCFSVLVCLPFGQTLYLITVPDLPVQKAFWVQCQTSKYHKEEFLDWYLPDLHHATVNDIFDPTYCNRCLSNVCTKNNFPHSLRSGPEHIQLLMRRKWRIQRVNFQTWAFALQVLQTKIYSNITTYDNQLLVEKFHTLLWKQKLMGNYQMLNSVNVHDNSCVSAPLLCSTLSNFRCVWMCVFWELAVLTSPDDWLPL